MSMITLNSSALPNVTLVSNNFIDEYMPKANGEFVKVYLYLLRILTTSPSVFSLEVLADILNCTEKDIARALKYWEQEKLLTISYDSNQNISNISLKNIETTSLIEKKASSPMASKDFSKNEISEAPKTFSKEKITPDRMKELKKQEGVTQLIYIAEQYLGKTLSPTELQTLMYFYDELKMSPELIEYLIEYCVSNNHRKMRYIESVALAWTENDITTVEAARNSSANFSKDYFTIFKFMGIDKRKPIESEVNFMNLWIHEYGFDMDVIKEACNRTVLSTGQSSFPYADKILSDWKKQNVRTLSDIYKLDANYKKKKLIKSLDSSKKPNKPNYFNNFQQREYNFDDYEKRLLNSENND